MRLYSNCRLFMCVLFALFMAACSQDPKPGTPEAAAASERLMRSMSDTLASSKAYTFETTERMEVIAPSGEKRALHFTRKVAVRRPNALFFELHGETDQGFDIAAYYNNRTLMLSENLDGKWAQTEVPGTLDEMLDDVMRRFGLPVPIGDVISSSPYDAIVGGSASGSLVAWETIEQMPCAKLNYADDFVEVRLWLPKSGPALPRRIEIAYKRAPVPLVSQLNFTNWKLDAQVTDDAFTLQPPAGRDPVEFGDLVSMLVSRVLPSELQVAVPGANVGIPAGESAAQ